MNSDHDFDKEYLSSNVYIYIFSELIIDLEWQFSVFILRAEKVSK